MNPTILATLRKYWFIAAALAVVLVFLFVWWLIGNGVTNSGNKQEQALNAQYNVNIGDLSTCIQKIEETAGVAKGQAAAVDGILLDAVKGRYDTPGSTAHVGGGKFFSAISEAYPDLTQVSATYQQVLTIINGCRSDYQGDQAKLQDEIASFEKWRTGSWTVRHFGGGFPNANLIARKGNTVLHGRAALDQMRVMVVLAEANTDYNTGQQQVVDPFATSTP